MKVQYDEDRAYHIGPKPCGAAREGCIEASVGGGAGQPLSLESPNPNADTVDNVEGNTTGGVIAIVSCRLGGVVDTGMRSSSLHGNREIS